MMRMKTGVMKIMNKDERTQAMTTPKETTSRKESPRELAERAINSHRASCIICRSIPCAQYLCLRGELDNFVAADETAKGNVYCYHCGAWIVAAEYVEHDILAHNGFQRMAASHNSMCINTSVRQTGSIGACKCRWAEYLARVIQSRALLSKPRTLDEAPQVIAEYVDALIEAAELSGYRGEFASQVFEFATPEWAGAWDINMAEAITHGRVPEQQMIDDKLIEYVRACNVQIIPEKLTAADIRKPIIIGVIDGADYVMDGWHRLHKAIAHGLEFVLCYALRGDEEKICRVYFAERCQRCKDLKGTRQCIDCNDKACGGDDMCCRCAYDYVTSQLGDY